MFAITADQVDSRHQPDRASQQIAELTAQLGNGLVLPIDRTAGDEIQLLLLDARDTMTAILTLTRSNHWSVGCGIGVVNTPLPANAREAGGDAFVAARTAVNEAKKRETRFALRTVAHPVAASDGEALITLLLQLRARRSPEGWQIYDLLATGKTQSSSAKILGITPQAASKRARSAGVRADLAALSPLARMLANVEAITTEESTP